MNNTLSLTEFRIRLAWRNRLFIFFSLVVPLAYMFFYVGVFGRGSPLAVSFMLAPVLALTVMGSFWGLSMQLVMFREQGILRRFRLAPIGAAPLLASSLLSNYILLMPTILIQLALARWFFRMQEFGNLPAALLLISAGSVTFAAFGLMIASITGSMQETAVINNAIWFIFLFLSGATIPLPMLPGWVQGVAAFLPPTYLITGLQQAMLGNAPVLQIGPELLVLAGSAAAAFYFSVQVFRWEPEAPIRPRARLLACAALIPFLLLGLYENITGHRREGAAVMYRQIQRPPEPQSR